MSAAIPSDIERGTKAKCTICGSNEVTNVQQFSDSRSLANAVADANLPKELAKELSSRLESKSAIEENRQQGPVALGKGSGEYCAVRPMNTEFYE